MSQETGNLSINSENILPIIKKWLYSDTDIFIRELVSNACDAIKKLQKLQEMGEANNISADEKYSVHVELNNEEKTIKIIDNGIGMTSDEIKQFINQIAFSGASAFIEKYKDKIGEGSDNEIIGHFGLGFYSAFMVAHTVQIDSLSFKPDATAAKWISDGGIEYKMDVSPKTTRGTEITLFVGEEYKEFLTEYKIREILNKYCSFMPVDVYLDVVKDVEESEDNKDEDTDENKEVELPKPINNTKPLWTKQPSECTDEEYKEFYKDVFKDFNDPLFWIHLNMDYPFKLKGILYFPKLKHDYETSEGEVKLFCNQVFVADNVKEVIPEFLLLLKGAIDCPEIPLNVSRSFLQNDTNVSKMSGYISKKVADKLNSIFKKDRESYIKYWDDISPFIKYGCIKDKSFYDKIKGSIIFKTTNDDFVTIDEYIERNKDKHENKVFYVSNLQQQSQYVKMFKEQDLEAVILTNNLDNPFISYLENYEQSVKFTRIDSDITDILNSEDKVDEETTQNITTLFKDNLDKKDIKIKVESLKTHSVSAVILLSEQSRRMQEMSKMFGNMGMANFPTEEELILNKNNNLVKTLLEIKDNPEKQEEVNIICKQIYDLAMMSHKPLDTEQMTAFIERSNKILEIVAKS